MSVVVTIRQNDTRPSVAMAFVTGALVQNVPVPLDLTGKVVTFTWKVPGMPVAKTMPASVTNAAAGLASYPWAAGDTANAGLNGTCEGRALDPITGETWSWPIDAPATLNVIQRVS